MISVLAMVRTDRTLARRVQICWEAQHVESGVNLEEASQEGNIYWIILGDGCRWDVWNKRCYCGRSRVIEYRVVIFRVLSKNESHCESVPIPEKLDKHNHDLTGSTTINSSRDSCVTYLALST